MTGLNLHFGKRVMLFGSKYIYTGRVVGVNEEVVRLQDAQIVQTTGPYRERGYHDEQKLPSNEWSVLLSSLESYGVIE